MENPFIRACRDTAKSYGLTWGTALRAALVPLVTFFLVYQVMGGKEAVSEGVILALSALAAVGAGLLPLFLWNLWLAPYRIMKEEVEQLRANSGGPRASLSATPVTARLNVKHWEGTKTFQLGVASCLWVEVRPHDPIEDDRAAGKFAQLSGAMMRGEIPYRPGGLRALSNAIDGKAAWPSYSHPISAVALRRYADATNDVPAFLQSVEVPPDPETAEQQSDKKVG